MGRMVFRILIILFVCFFKQSAFSQKENVNIGKHILETNGIKSISHVALNKNGYFLELKEKEAKKLAKVILYDVYGKPNIWKQKPFFTYKIDDLWIFKGSIKKHKKGGVFIIVINSKNGCVEYLSHGK